VVSEDDLNVLSGKLAAAETVLTGLVQDFLRRTSDPHASAEAMIAVWTQNAPLAGQPPSFVAAYNDEINLIVRTAERTLQR
jgi:hypothetical protein